MLGSHSNSPYPLAGFKWSTSKGGHWREEEGRTREREGTRREGRFSGIDKFYNLAALK